MKPAFANGTEFMQFDDHNCSRCIKAAKYHPSVGKWTLSRCKAEEEIARAAVTDGMVSDRVASITNNFTIRGITCPYLKTKHKRYDRKINNQTELEQ